MSWDWASNEASSLYHSAGQELSGVGHELSGVGHELSGVGHELSGVGHELSGVGHKLSAAGHEVAHFAEVTGEATLHSAIQDPIDALTQLANHVVKALTGYQLPTLQLIDAPPPAKVGTEDWYAEMLGTGLGKVIDFVALSAAMEAVGVTAAVGSAAAAAGKLPVVSDIVAEVAEHPILVKFAGSVSKGAWMGGVYGTTLLPAHDETHFWRERTANGIGLALAGGVAGAVTEGASLAYKALGLPAEDEAFELSAKHLGTRAVTVALRSGSNHVVTNSTISLLAGSQP